VTAKSVVAFCASEVRGRSTEIADFSGDEAILSRLHAWNGLGGGDFVAGPLDRGVHITVPVSRRPFCSDHYPSPAPNVYTWSAAKESAPVAISESAKAPSIRCSGKCAWQRKIRPSSSRCHTPTGQIGPTGQTRRWKRPKGSTFQHVRLQPAAGWLLTEDDYRTLSAHPYAVLSYDCRFGK